MNPKSILLSLSFISCSLGASGQEKAQDRSMPTQPRENAAISLQAVPENSPFKDLLAEVNAKAPQNYPAKMTAVPESKDFDKIETATLMTMLESWNPALRKQASTALSDRGEAVMGALKQGLKSNNWMVRAGSASALSAIITQSIKGLKAEAMQAALNKHSDVASEFVRLVHDEQLEVRVAALEGLSVLAPQTPEAAKAVLHLCNDPDDYLSQNAMVALYKHFTIDALEQDEVVTAFKASLTRELPNGKGCIISIIKGMKPEMQRKFIPDLLAFLDWKVMRDTMFILNGPEDAIKILTKLKEPQLIGRLPTLMGKIRERGDGLFVPCLTAAKAYGKDAKVILPQLKAILADIEKNGDKAAIRPNRNPEAPIKELKNTIAYLEGL